MATKKADTPTPTPTIVDPKTERLTVLAEDSIRLMIQATGGLVGQPNGKGVRQLVRELRHMYDEIDRPTVEAKTRGDGKARLMASESDDDDEGDY